MAQSERIGGIDTYILYGEESTYGTPVTPNLKFGGLIQSADFDIDRQYREHAGMVGTGTAEGRATSQFTTGTLQVRSTAEFLPQRWDWLQYLLLGTRTGAGTSGNPYIYTLGSSIRSLTLTEQITNVDTDSLRTYPGTVIDSATIRLTSGEPVSVNVDMIGGKLTKSTILNAIIANLSDEIYNFSGATIEMPDGSSIGNIIEDGQISISNGMKLKYGMNIEAQSARPGRLQLGINFRLNYLDDDQMDQLMGSTTAISSQTPVTLSLKFSRNNGSQYVDFVFTNVVITKIRDTHALNEYVIEENNLLGSQLHVVEVQS